MLFHWLFFNNLVDSNLSKVSTDAKANPEFIKPKRREMPYSKVNHIIYVSTVRNTTLQSPCRAHGATSYMSTWQKLNDGVFPTDDARARWMGIRAPHVPYTQFNRRRTFKQNPPVTHYVDSVTNLRHLLKCLLHDSWTGVNESSREDLEQTKTNVLEGFIGTIAVGGGGGGSLADNCHNIDLIAGCKDTRRPT